MQWPIQHKVVVAIEFKCRRIILNTKFAIPFLVAFPGGLSWWPSTFMAFCD